MRRKVHRLLRTAGNKGKHDPESRRPRRATLTAAFLAASIALCCLTAPICFGSVEVTVTPEAATNAVGTEHTIVVTFASNGFKLANTEASFRVTDGPNAGLEQKLIADREGKVVFRYTSNGEPGMDTIRIVGVDPDTNETIRCPTATKTWVQAEEEPEDEPKAPSDTERLFDVLLEMNKLLDRLLYESENYKFSLLFNPRSLRDGLAALAELFSSLHTAEPGLLQLLPDVAGISMEEVYYTFEDIKVDHGFVQRTLARAESEGTLGTPSVTMEVLDVLDRTRRRLEELRGYEHDGGATQFMQELSELEDYLRDVMLDWANAPDDQKLLSQLESFASGADFSLTALPDVRGVGFSGLYGHLSEFDRLLRGLDPEDPSSAVSLAAGFDTDSSPAERDALVAILQGMKQHKEAIETAAAPWRSS